MDGNVLIIPFIPGIILVLLFYIVLAKYWCKFADWIGNKIGLKKIIEWILNKIFGVEKKPDNE